MYFLNRYEDLVNTSKRKVSSVWSCNLGDTVIDIQTIQQGAEMCVVILSEHNVICVNTKGVVKFTKRLQFSPISFRVYVNGVFRLRYTKHFTSCMYLNENNEACFVFQRLIMR